MASICAPIGIDNDDPFLKGPCMAFTRTKRSVRMDCKPGPSEQVISFHFFFYLFMCSTYLVLYLLLDLCSDVSEPTYAWMAGLKARKIRVFHNWVRKFKNVQVKKTHEIT